MTLAAGATAMMAAWFRTPLRIVTVRDMTVPSSDGTCLDDEGRTRIDPANMRFVERAVTTLAIAFRLH